MALIPPPIRSLVPFFAGSALGRLALALVCLCLLSAAARADRTFSVVEIFTSQGCSSCPPADDNVRRLADRKDVLALTFAVTYWDSLGWKDTFAQPLFTARQTAYARALGRTGPFTPEVVVDGRVDTVGARPGEIEALLRPSAVEGPAPLSLQGRALRLGAGPRPGAPADVWLVRYDPQVVQIPVRAGENNGKTLELRNVVRSLSRLGAWSGRAETFELPPAPAGLATAVLVEAPGGGRILAAARD